MNDKNKTRIASNITITNIGTPVKFIADIAGSINQHQIALLLLLLLSGWDSVTNNVIAPLGDTNDINYVKGGLSVYKKPVHG